MSLRGSYRWSRRIGAALLVAVAMASVGWGLAKLEIDTTIAELVPDGTGELESWERMQRAFGADPIVVLLETDTEGALLEEHLRGLVALEGDLAGLQDVAVVYGPGTVLNQTAIQAQNLLASISGTRDGLIEAARRSGESQGLEGERLQAHVADQMASFESRYGSLLLQGMQVGLPTLGNQQFARAAATDDQGRIRPSFRWLLPDLRHAAVVVRPAEELDQAETDRLVRRVRERVGESVPDGVTATVTGSPVISSGVAGALREDLPLLAIVGVTLVAGVFLADRHLPWRRRLLPLAISLAATGSVLGAYGLLGVPMSLGLLAFLPILVGVGSDFPVHVLHGARRVDLVGAAVATAVAFVSLWWSPLPFVRQLGLALALGTLLSLGLALVLHHTVRNDLPATSTRSQRADSIGPRPDHPRWLRAVAGLAASGAVIGWLVLPAVPVEARPDQLAAGVPELETGREAEAVLGASGEIAVTLRGEDVLSSSALAWFREVDRRLAVEHGDRLRPVTSPTRLMEFLGDDPTQAQIEAGAGLVPTYLLRSAVRGDRQQAVSTYGVRLDDLGRQAELIRSVESLLPPAPEGHEADVTGLPVLAARTHTALSEGRLGTNLVGIAAAAGAVLLVLRRWRLALVFLITSAVAAGWGVLLVHVTGASLNPLTIGLGSLTAAVGGEFAIMAGVTRGERDWRSVTVAGITSIAGFLALLVSDLQALREFGLVLTSSVVLALLAARTVAVLVSPPSVSASTTGAPRTATAAPTQVPT